MPSNRKVKKALKSYLPAETKGTIYELGSGWGGVAFLLARLYPNCSIVAIEGSPIPYLFAKLLGWRYSNLTIRRGDFFDCSLWDATGIYCYLYPGGMKKLQEKFKEELHPDAWVVSNTFSLPGWSPEAVYQVNDLYRSNLYLYRLATAAIASPPKNHAITESAIPTTT